MLPHYNGCVAGRQLLMEEIVGFGLSWFPDTVSAYRHGSRRSEHYRGRVIEMFIRQRLALVMKDWEITKNSERKRDV